MTLRQIVKALSIAWMFLSAYTFHLVWWVGALFAVMGILTVGMVSPSPVHPAQLGRGITIKPLRIFWPLVVAGCLSLLLFSEISGNLLQVSLLISPHLQFALFIFGVLALVVGFAGWRLPRFKIPLGLLAVTVLALGLRLCHLETAVHFLVDEMNFAHAVWSMQQHDFVPLAAPFSDITAFTWLYPYWQMWGIGVFGHTLTALRIVSVVLSVATIPALYFLVKVLFEDDEHLPVLAALLLAVFPPHIHFSRIGINNIADPLFGVLMLLFLVRGLKYQRLIDYVLGGVMLGLTQYFYEGGRVVYPLLALFWLELLAITRRIRIDVPVARRIGLFALVGVLVAFPVYYTLLAQRDGLFTRFEIAGISSDYYRALRYYDLAPGLEQHLTFPFRIYVQLPDYSLFYGGNTALLLVLVVPFFLLGVAWALWRIKQPGMLLVLLWVFGTSAGSAFLADSGFSARFVVAFPALMILVALGVRYVFQSRWLLLVAALLLSVYQVGYYFTDHLPTYNQQLRPTLDAQDAVFRMADLPEDQEVCFVSDLPLDQLYLLQLRDYLDLPQTLCFLATDTLDVLLSNRPESTDHMAFFLHPDDTASLMVLNKHMTLAGPFFTPYASVPPDKQFVLYINCPMRSGAMGYNNRRFTLCLSVEETA